MALLVHWKNSLNVLKPKNAYLLFLVSLKAAFDGLRLLFPFIVGWLIGELLVWLFKNFVFFGDISREAWAGVPFLYISQANNHHIFLFLILVAFAIHPSVKKKTINSFLSFDFIKLYIFIFVGFLFVFSSFFLFAPSLCDFCAWIEKYAAIVGDFVFEFIYSFFVPNLIFFFLDTEGGFWSRTVLVLKRTAKVIYYNAPVWIILLIFTCFIKLGMVMLQCFLLNNVSKIAGLLFGTGMHIICTAVLVAIVNTVYIKRVYDQKELYV